MMLSTIFLCILFNVLYGLKPTDATLTRREQIDTLERKLDSIDKSMDEINQAIQSLKEKFATITVTEKPNTISPDCHEKFQAFDRKLDLLQRSQEEQEAYNNKLTALEFTLNHVLSKVVYLSDNIQPRTAEDLDVQRENAAARTHADDVEILVRLNDLLYHVQSIKRENCRRSSIPAAAGPVVGTMKSEKSTSPLPKGDQACLISDQTIDQIVYRFKTEAVGDLQDLPTLLQKHYEQSENMFDVVKKTDKRLENWSTEDLQHQNWQRMIQYCQDVSNEFSSFAGNSDALLKRIESFLRDMVQTNKRKNFPPACAGRKHTNLEIIGSSIESNMTNANITGFDLENVDVIPDKTGCHELFDRDHKDGIYRFGTPHVNDAGRDYNTRYCAFATTDDDDERAWTVIQRRGSYDTQENFNRSWSEYRDGFGQLNKDFWFGNKFIHRLTSKNNYELLIELENFDGGIMSVRYGSFGIDSEHHNYSLFIGNYKGPGPDSLLYHNFMDFSTYDYNNYKDLDSCCACAVGYGSGWWFDSCLEANLNGIYRNEPLNHSYVGIIWEHWLGDYSLKSSRMLVRPKNWTLESVENEPEIDVRVQNF